MSQVNIIDFVPCLHEHLALLSAGGACTAMTETECRHAARVNTPPLAAGLLTVIVDRAVALEIKKSEV